MVLQFVVQRARNSLGDPNDPHTTREEEETTHKTNQRKNGKVEDGARSTKIGKAESTK